MTKKLLYLLFTLALVLCGLGARAQAATEPSAHDIYQAASSGDLPRARTLVDQVLEKHPNSAKAHYIKAEITARQQDAATARSELQQAERIAPGLPFAKPEAVSALRSQIAGLDSGTSTRPAQRAPTEARRMGAPPSSGGFGFGGIIVLVLVVVGVIIFMRSRQRPVASYPSPVPDNGFGRYDGGPPQQPWGTQPYGNVPPGGYPGAYPAPQQPGLGSTLGRGLATGLAVGAGAVAAQEIGRRIFEHGHQPADNGNYPLHGGSGADSSLARDAGLGSLGGGGANADFGGNDFGIVDNGGWDDNGGGSFDAGGDDNWD